MTTTAYINRIHDRVLNILNEQVGQPLTEQDKSLVWLTVQATLDVIEDYRDHSDA